MSLPHLTFAETKAACFLAYNALEGEEYRFPDQSLWYVRRHWSSMISGFKAITLKPRGEGRRIVVLSFAGTNSVVDAIMDIYQVQGGMPAQYIQALLLAAECQGKYGSRLYLTGHSLGGGLAAYCSVKLRIPASTINPAPLIGAADISALFGNNSQITNYVAEGGEIVSSSPGRNPGKEVSVPAQGNFLTKHLLDNVSPSVPMPTQMTTPK